MADRTKIEWTDSTWNVINGCSVVSPGCTNCYAMRLAGTRMKHHPSRAGLTVDSKAAAPVGRNGAAQKGHPVWTGEVRFNDKVLLDPLRWRRPRKIFVCAHGDLFHEKVPDERLDRVFAVMALAPQHNFQVLTKRPERMRAYLTGAWQGRLVPNLRELDPHIRKNPGHGVLLRTTDGVLPNVWLGVSVEDQKRADERIPILLDTPAAVRWLSMEPLLGPVDLTRIERGVFKINALKPYHGGLGGPARKGIDWIVLGGESGPGARPMHPGWARSLRDQCAAAGVPFLFKQWGEWCPYDPMRDDYTKNDPTSEYGENESHHQLNPGEQPGAENIVVRLGKRRAGRLLDGVQHDGFPA